MNRKMIVPAVFAVCLVAVQAVVPTVAHASESPLRAIIAASPVAGVKLIKINLANNTSAPVDVRIGETSLTLAAGETVNLSAPNGAKIVYANTSSTHEAGTVMAQISKEMSGATIRIN